MRLRLAFLLALFLPELPLDPLRADLGCSWIHPLGTDALGRDGLLRLLQAGVAAYSAALAGLGGGLYASLYSITPEIGGGYILKGVEAAILAGIGSVMGSFAGGTIIGVAEGIGSIFLPSAYNDAYGLVFLVLILLFKPAGLFGRPLVQRV